MTDALPQRIPSGDAPDPLGAYAHAVQANGMIFCPGQGARDPVTGREAGIKTDAEGRVRGPGASCRSATTGRCSDSRTLSCTRLVVELVVSETVAATARRWSSPPCPTRRPRPA